LPKTFTLNSKLNEEVNSMRIAILGTRGIPSGYSGYETFAEEIAWRLVERGHEVVVYCRRSVFHEHPATYRGVKLIYLPSVQTKSLSTFSHMFLSSLDVLFRHVDIALVTNVANSLFCLMPKLAGIKTIINVDGLEWLRPKWGSWGKRYFYLSAKVARYTANKVVTDAKEMQEIYLREFSTPSACITYGANIETSRRPELIQQFGLVPGEYFFTGCRLVPDNNLDLIIEAFSHVATEKKYVIAGGIPYADPYVQRLKQTKDPRVIFLGHIDDQNIMRELHCNAYAYLHGHQFGGTNPSLLKALAYGNCVLALDTPFNREVLQSYGLLFQKDSKDLGERIRYLVTHPEIQSDYSRRAPQRILEEYTWDHIADQYELLFCQTRGLPVPE
jgi:glycosyltransferase involved in cell wall biosynthesis